MNAKCNDYSVCNVFLRIIIGETTLNSACIKSYKMAIICRDGIMGMKFKFFSKKIVLLSISTDSSWSAEDNSTSRRLFLVLNSYLAA